MPGLDAVPSNPYVTRQPEEAINRVLNKAADNKDTIGSQYPGKSYEDGLIDSLEWVFGMAGEEPLA